MDNLNQICRDLYQHLKNIGGTDAEIDEIENIVSDIINREGEE